MLLLRRYSRFFSNKTNKLSHVTTDNLPTMVNIHDKKVTFHQDNRVNPYRWMAPFNDIHHNETSSTLLYSSVDDSKRAKTEILLDEYLNGANRLTHLILKYRINFYLLAQQELPLMQS